MSAIKAPARIGMRVGVGTSRIEVLSLGAAADKLPLGTCGNVFGTGFAAEIWQQDTGAKACSIESGGFCPCIIGQCGVHFAPGCINIQQETKPDEGVNRITVASNNAPNFDPRCI